MRSALRRVAFLAGLLALPLRLHAAVYYVTIAGLGGEPDYEQRFKATAKDLDKIFRNSPDAHVFTLLGPDATKTKITAILTSVAREAHPTDDLLLTLIGHGSFDGAEYKFNVIGPDLSGTDIASLCDRIPAKRQLIVNTTSASGGSIAALERPGRAVIAATKAGTEKNATVFARYWVEALQDPATDLDKNESVSALEAFKYADRKTAAFYESQKRLATEHAVFEDTGRSEAVRVPGKGEGTLLAGLTVLRIGTSVGAALDPAKRDLLAKKEDLEQKIDTLKYEKAAMEPAAYKQQLTQALLQLAQVQQELDK